MASAAKAPETAEASPIYSQRYETCMDAAKGVTSGMVACIDEELKTGDARLNAVYRRVLGGLDDAARGSLRDKQRAWIAERDRRCAALLGQGTIDRLNVHFCHLDTTIARTRELEAMAPTP